MSRSDIAAEPIGVIGVIGVGYVGLVTAACFASRGLEVVCRDIDEHKVAALQRGEVPIHEPGLAELVAEHAARLRFTTDLDALFERASLAFVCVDTPPTVSGDADLSRVQRVIDAIPATAAGAVLAMKSTVPVGTGRRLRAELDARGLEAVGYVSNPEFLREGTAIADFMHPDRIVIGAERPADGDRVAALYAGFECPILRIDVPSAEMVKLASNAFLATKISFVNEIANVCEEVGADVSDVARGMGLDPRIGASFLRPGVGYGGSCLAGEETVLVRRGGAVRLLELQALFAELEEAHHAHGAAVIEPDGLEVLAWDADEGARFLPVAAATRRRHEGELVELRTKMGRRLRCTPDHPFVVGDADGHALDVRLAGELTTETWLPLAGQRDGGAGAQALAVLEGQEAGGLTDHDVRVRVGARERQRLATLPLERRRTALTHARGSRIRLYDAVRTGVVTLHEARSLDCEVAAGRLGTARNGTYVPAEIVADEAFWRVVGLYLAEGHCNVEASGRRRLQWSFHPSREQHLVDEVAAYWRGLGIDVAVTARTTAACVALSSRLLAAWWVDVLGAGRSSYDHRLPDAIWDAPDEHKRALLSGLWDGDGSWSLVNGGPSVILEYGTVSRALADGMLRLLGDLGVVAAVRVGRTARSTVDTYWLRISGAEQIERAAWLLPERSRSSALASVLAQVKRIAPTGYRRRANAAWVRVTDITRRPFAGDVYSLEVPGPHTFVTTGGLVTHNCFPKDVSALKQLAGNTGYAFQLLAAVIEVNELQKRRVVTRLQRDLDGVRGKRIALLGLAFKPNTDDMREASSLVLAGRLVAEGARVIAYDPIAGERARPLLDPKVELAGTMLEALHDADAAVIVTEWDEFQRLLEPIAREQMRGSLLIDGRNMLDPAAAAEAGYDYRSVGRPARKDVPVTST